MVKIIADEGHTEHTFMPRLIEQFNNLLKAFDFRSLCDIFRQMKQLKAVLESLSNLALIILAVIACFLYIGQRRAAHSAIPHQSVSSGPVVGQKISIPSFDFSQHPVNVILALQTDCRYCTASRSQIKMFLDKSSRNAGVRTIAVMPGDRELARQYLDHQRLIVDLVTAELSAVDVYGTPTVLVCDSKGFVKKVWVGQISDSTLAQMISLTS